MPVYNRFHTQLEEMGRSRARVEQARDEVYPVVPVDGRRTWRLETEPNPFEAAGADVLHRVRLADLPKLDGLADLLIGDRTVRVPLYFGVGGVDYVAAADLAPHLGAIEAAAAQEAELEEIAEAD
jgi:hypothetical protein